MDAPVRCVWFAVVLALLLGLLSFAGPDTIGAIFMLPVISQYASYLIPILARHFGGQKVLRGPFHLGVFVCVQRLYHSTVPSLISTLFFVEPAYCDSLIFMDGTDDGCFPLPCEYESWTAKHELRDSGFLYVSFPPMAWPFFTLYSIGGVLFLATVYFYFPKYGARYWFEGPIRPIGDLNNFGKDIPDEKGEKQAF